MDNRQYKILEHLANKGQGVFSIREPLLEIYPNVDNKERAEVKDAARAVDRPLKSMTDSKYIAVESYRPLGVGTKNGYTWLNTVDVKASMKEEGQNVFNFEL